MSMRLSGDVKDLTILALLIVIGLLVYRYFLKVKVVEVSVGDGETSNGGKPVSSSPPEKRNPDFKITA